MTREQAIDVLRRTVENGENFEPAVLRQAIVLAHALDADELPPRGFDAAPTGCIWQRPAPGWVDLARRAA